MLLRPVRGCRQTNSSPSRVIWKGLATWLIPPDLWLQHPLVVIGPCTPGSRIGLPRLSTGNQKSGGINHVAKPLADGPSTVKNLSACSLGLASKA